MRVKREHLNTRLRAGAANQNAAIAVHTNALWLSQLPMAERGDEAAICREHLHATVSAVAHQPIVRAVDRYVVRKNELSIR